ncbi:UNVERIFIED_CONTAM: hypothetical protein FKN15_011385 [Acipenser sinensis]
MLRIGLDKRHGVPEKLHRPVAGKLQSDALQHTHAALWSMRQQTAITRVGPSSKLRLDLFQSQLVINSIKPTRC